MRDIATEMRKHLDAAMVGDYEPAAAAREIVDHLREHDPGLLVEYLEEEAVRIVADRIRRLNHSARTAARHQARRSVFVAATEAFENADGAGRAEHAVVLVDWLNGVHYRLRDGTHRLFGDCTGVDLEFQIDAYRRTARTAQFEAAFLTAVARKAGDRPVRVAFSNDEITALRGGLPALDA